MSTIIHSKIKGTVYCYRSESYWDKESKSPKSRRVLIGKIDPETGEMVPTGPRGRRKRAEGDKAAMAGAENTMPAINAGISGDQDYERRYMEVKRELLSVEKELVQVKGERDEARKKLERLTEAVRMLPI